MTEISKADELVAKARKDGFLLCKTRSENAAPGCYLGGLPTLPEHLAWPHTDISDLPSTPLHFVGQINLAALPTDQHHTELPRSGTVFFFLDPINGPPHGYANGTATVLYTEEDVATVPERPMPPVQSSDAPQQYPFEKWNIQFEPCVSYDWHLLQDYYHRDDDAIEKATALGLEEIDRIRNVLKTKSPDATDRARHSMFAGPSSPCWLVDGEAVYDFEKIPLLALKSDFDLGLRLDEEWVVFWMPPDDLAEGNFASVYVYEGID